MFTNLIKGTVAINIFIGHYYYLWFVETYRFPKHGITNRYFWWFYESRYYCFNSTCFNQKLVNFYSWLAQQILIEDEIF